MKCVEICKLPFYSSGLRSGVHEKLSALVSVVPPKVGMKMNFVILECYRKSALVFVTDFLFFALKISL